MRLAVGAIVKNEAPYLLEWISWHRAIGVTHFFIADNDSIDETTEILRALQKARLVRRIAFPGRLHKIPQFDAYDHILQRAAGRFDWVALIDADEFIAPATDEDDLPATLAGLPADVGAVALNWAIFGSSGLRAASGEPVFQRFLHRATQDIDESRMAYGNRLYKSIIRTAAYGGGILNPHHPRIAKGFRYARMSGADLPLREPGISADVDWRGFRLNHYMIKSWAEFVLKKQGRGRADQPHRTRSFDYFYRHDFNDEQDGMPARFIRRFEEERALLLRVKGVGEATERAVAQTVAFSPPPYQPPEIIEGEDDLPIPRKQPSKLRRKIRFARLRATATMARVFGLDV
ncbi:glycosyltransferase family 2 protein [Acetobacteraceae bacterium H6797]|nr:glycosyltransferase family 2 protein [Acetobacteraceae bacterium H6797]